MAPLGDSLKIHTAFASIFLVMLLLPGCAATPETSAASAGFTLDEILGRMPPRDTLEARWLNSALQQLGPDAIGELCKRLDPAGSARSAQAEFALQSLALSATREGAERDRAKYVSALAGVLERQPSERAAAFILGRLQTTGKGESIAPVSRFLTDPRLCEPAARALVAIGDGADRALLTSLPGAGAECRITIIQSLGELRSARAVETLVKEAATGDRQIRIAALEALANIGDSRAGDVLARSVADSSPRERNDFCSSWLLFAGRRLEAGDTVAAVEIARKILSAGSPGGGDPVRPAALRILVRAKGGEAVVDLQKVMADTSRQMRRAALDCAEKVGGEGATAQWVDASAAARPEVRAEILAMLGRRGDAAASSAAIQALRDPDPAIREAAAEASARLGGAEAVGPLLAVLERSAEPGDIAAVRKALERIPAASVVPQVVDSLPRLTPAASAAMLDFLGKCGTAVPAGPVGAIAKTGTGPAQLAAIRTLGAIGGESAQRDLSEITINSGDDGVRAAAQKSLAAVCLRGPDPEKRADPLLEEYRAGTKKEQMALLPVIGRVGGRRALAIVSSEIRNADPDLRESAVRALSEWPSIAAYDTLLAVAKGKEKLNLRVLALRGCVRMVENASLTPTEAIRYHERTLAAAERTEEKRLVIGALANLRTPYALKVVAPYVGDDSLGLDAAVAAGRISAGIAPPANDPGASRVARAFIDATVPAKYRERVDRTLDLSPEMNDPPEGFRPLFNGRNLDGWKGLVENPVARSKMTPAQLSAAQAKADSSMRAHWSVADGVLVFDGKGESLCTAEDFGDFEMFVDWKIDRLGDSGIYLRGSPQVQIWDPAQWPEGSGGLYNNQKNPSKPLRCADRPIGEWNTFRIKMIGERVTVWLNEVLVVDSVVMENYWDRSIPIFPSGQIELQSHSSPLAFRNISIREFPRRKPLFAGSLFNGTDLRGWKVVGGTGQGWGAKDGILFTTGEGGGWLSTDREYDNFELELDFRVGKGGNSGVFLRSPREGDPAYTGMEIQVLDDYAEQYATLRPWQYCGSLYGVVAAERGASKRANEWQHYRIVACGPHVTVTLNGRTIVDADLIAHMDQESTHPGLKRRSGFIGLQCHGDRIEYRNIMLKELEWRESHDGD